MPTPMNGPPRCDPSQPAVAEYFFLARPEIDVEPIVQALDDAGWSVEVMTQRASTLLVAIGAPAEQTDEGFEQWAGSVGLEYDGSGFGSDDGEEVDEPSHAGAMNEPVGLEGWKLPADHTLPLYPNIGDVYQLVLSEHTYIRVVALDEDDTDLPIPICGIIDAPNRELSLNELSDLPFATGTLLPSSQGRPKALVAMILQDEGGPPGSMKFLGNVDTSSHPPLPLLVDAITWPGFVDLATKWHRKRRR